MFDNKIKKENNRVGIKCKYWENSELVGGMKGYPNFCLYNCWYSQIY